MRMHGMTQNVISLFAREMFSNRVLPQYGRVEPLLVPLQCALGLAPSNGARRDQVLGAVPGRSRRPARHRHQVRQPATRGLPPADQRSRQGRATVWRREGGQGVRSFSAGAVYKPANWGALTRIIFSGVLLSKF